MVDKCFYSAKKLYDEIARLCLVASFEKRETDCFKVYESIARKCYNLLIVVKDFAQKEKVDEPEGVKKLNENIFKAYYLNNNSDDDYQRDVCFRAKLSEWKENANAYENLKAFSGKDDDGKSESIDDIIEVLKEVLALLKTDNRTENTQKRILFLLDGIIN